jgi:hypothetical protein
MTFFGERSARLFPPAALPVAILPVEGTGVDNFAGAMHVPRLKPGGWVGDFLPSIDPEMVLGPGPGCIGNELKLTFIAPVQRKPHGPVRACKA